MTISLMAQLVVLQWLSPEMLVLPLAEKGMETEPLGGAGRGHRGRIQVSICSVCQ